MIAHKGKNYGFWMDLVQELEQQRDEALAALRGLLIEDPHDLLDSRPCKTCASGFALLARATDNAPHKTGCICRPCLNSRKANSTDLGGK